jgi:hypothetical protein
MLTTHADKPSLTLPRASLPAEVYQGGGQSGQKEHGLRGDRTLGLVSNSRTY